MAFRQECSSGRLTGFIWIVFDPPGTEESLQRAAEDLPPSSKQQLLTPSDSFVSARAPPETPPRRQASILESSPIKFSLTPGMGTGSPSKVTTAQAQEKRKERRK